MGSSTAITCCDGGDPAVWFTRSQLFASQSPNGRVCVKDAGRMTGCANTAWDGRPVSPRKKPRGRSGAATRSRGRLLNVIIRQSRRCGRGVRRTYGHPVLGRGEACWGRARGDESGDDLSRESARNRDSREGCVGCVGCSALTWSGLGWCDDAVRQAAAAAAAALHGTIWRPA